MTIIRCLLFAYFLGHGLLLFGQVSKEIHRYDASITRQKDLNQEDSFLYYIRLKLQVAKSADSLETWSEAKGDLVNYYWGNKPKTLNILLEIPRERWREPKTPVEWQWEFDFVATTASLFSQTGRIWESIQSFQKADTIYQLHHPENRDITEFVYKTLGNNYTRLGDNEKALVVFQKALEYTQKKDDPESLAGLYNNIAIAYWNNKNYSAAEENCRIGLALKGISAQKKAFLSSTLTTTLVDANRIPEALALARIATSVLHPVSEKDWEVATYAAQAAANACIKAKMPDQAFLYLRKALICAPKGFKDAHNRIYSKIDISYAQAWLSKQSPEKALQSANSALAKILPGFQPSNDLQQPDPVQFFQENGIGEALHLKATAFEMGYAQKKDPTLLIKGLECLDLAWTANNILRENFIYQSSKLLFQDEWRQWDEDAIRLCRILFDQTHDTQWAARAFDIAERNKAAILLDALRENMTRQRVATTDPRFDELSKLRQSIALLEHDILQSDNASEKAQLRISGDAIRTKIAALETEMRNKYPDLTRRLPDLSTFSGKGALQPGEALVEYFSGNDMLDIFVRNATGQVIAWKQVKNDAQLTDVLQAFLHFFTDANIITADPGGYFDAAFRLWQTIVPAEVNTLNQLVIAPDGITGQIPFEALITAAASPQTTLKNAPYLLKSQRIRYIWSLSTLFWQQALTTATQNRLLGFAPGFEHGERGLQPLHADGKEWQNAGGPKALSGADATRSAFMELSPDYSLIHLATHANAGESPRIEFFDDGFYLPDIYALHLQAELVVLSACETGTGKEAKGEGIMSLSRAFACAGARSLIGSFWKVNDESTAVILSDFYKNLRNNLSKSDALREAKLHYLEQDGPMVTKSPWYWAAFSFSGADGEVPLPQSNFTIWMIGAAIGVALSALLYRLKKQTKTPLK